MAWPAQVSGDGWVVDKLVSGRGKTPIPGKKQLRGKTVKKTITASNIKRALVVHGRKKGVE